MSIKPPAPRGPAGYWAPLVETRNPTRQSCNPKCRPKRAPPLIGIIDEEPGRLAAVTENGKHRLVLMVRMIVAPMTRARVWWPIALHTPSEPRSTAAGLLTLPGRLMTVYKAIEMGMAVRRRAPAHAASPSASTDTPAEAIDGDVPCQRR
jgi:hypothetical protein